MVLSVDNLQEKNVIPATWPFLQSLGSQEQPSCGKKKKKKEKNCEEIFSMNGLVTCLQQPATDRFANEMRQPLLPVGKAPSPGARDSSLLGYSPPIRRLSLPLSASLPSF